jgi:hypothetical protein
MLIFFMLVSRALIGLSPFRAIRAQHRGVLSLRVGTIPPVDPVDVIERILKHLKVGHPRIENRSSAGPDPSRPEGQTIPLT